jgi:predicted PurR-regulated permease PerM
MPATRVLLTLASVIVVIAGLKAAQAILIPVLLALLLAILCSPPVFWLRAHRVPTVAAVLLVVLVLLGVFTICGVVVGGSINGFMEAAPRYQERIDALGTSLTGWLKAQGVNVGEIDTSDSWRPPASPSRCGPRWGAQTPTSTASPRPRERSRSTSG